MKIRIVQKDRKLDGMVGDIIEVDPTFGHHLAGIGKAVVVEHDKPGADRGCVVRNAPGVTKKKRADDEYHEE